MSLHALGGGELRGSNLVRFAYLDESGTGSIDKEPTTVVAAVLVHADRDWKLVEKHLVALADQFALPSDRPDFVFHAVELMNGGKVVTRDKYSIEKRTVMLEALCNTPILFKLPLFAYALDRRKVMEDDPSLSVKEATDQAIAACATFCAQGIERFMRKTADASEVVTLVYEDNASMRKHLKTINAVFRSRALPGHLQANPHLPFVPFERIIETAHFASKTDSSLLQLSDVVAYFCGRHIRKVPDDEKFMKAIRAQLAGGSRSLTAS